MDLPPRKPKINPRLSVTTERVPARNRTFESMSLQRRVRCELDWAVPGLDEMLAGRRSADTDRFSGLALDAMQAQTPESGPRSGER